MSDDEEIFSKDEDQLDEEQSICDHCDAFTDQIRGTTITDQISVMQSNCHDQCTQSICDHHVSNLFNYRLCSMIDPWLG